jgi:hypothetical protein
MDTTAESGTRRRKQATGDAPLPSSYAGAWLGVFLGVAAAGFTPLSCGSSEEKDALCEGCTDQGENTYNCYGGLLGAKNFLGSVCMPPGSSASQVEFECATELSFAGQVNLVDEAPCDGSGFGFSSGSADCQNWDPGAEINLVSGVYEVDGLWFAALLSNFPEQEIWACDDARFADINPPGYELEGADAGEMLYELGLRNGDKPKKLNGYDLNDFEDVSTALAELYYEQLESEYELEVRRGNQTITLNYELVYDPV